MTRASRSTWRQADEQAFLAGYDAAQYPHPSVAVDVALVTAAAGQLKAALVQRGEHPDLGKWSLPGGFVRIDESLEAGAARVLKAKLGVQGIFLEQLFTFGDPNRDPRTRVIAVAYYALVPATRLTATSGWQLAALEVPWEGEQGGAARARNEAGRRLPLAFDHARMLGLVVQRLRGKLDYAPIGFELLPREFTLRELQDIHETIRGRKLNKDSFRRRLLASGLVEATGRLEREVGHRPAELYRFRPQHRRARRE